MNVSTNAVEAFLAEFGQLAALVRKRVELEWRFHKHAALSAPELRDLLDYGDSFGRLLKVIYRHSLFAALQDEFSWYAAVFASRPSGPILLSQLLESWIFAIEGVIKPPECNELAAPLHSLHATLPSALEKALSLRDGSVACAHPEFAERVLRGDVAAARAYLVALVESGTPWDALITEVLLPTMAYVGWKWELHEIEIFEEHLATETVRMLLASVPLLPAAPAEQRARTALVSCVPGDRHDLVALALWAYLSLRGWRAINLGTSLPSDQLTKAAARFSVHSAFLVATQLSDLDDALETASILRNVIPGHVIAGGHGAEVGRSVLEGAGVGVASSFAEAIALAEQGG
jgi:methanogenic corrinoid protein MtbC1